MRVQSTNVARSGHPLHGARFTVDPVSGAAMRRLRVGVRTLMAVSDGFLTMSPDLVGTDEHPTAAFDELSRQYDPPRLPLGCFLLLGEPLVLVDTGMGPVDFNGEGRLVGGGLEGALARIGVKCDDIGIVALSHLHADHSGNLADPDSGELLFPRAHVILGQEDWEYFIDDDAAPVPIGDHVVAALHKLRRQGQLELVAGDLDIAPGVRRLAAPGHTPGHSIYSVADSGDRVLLVGDAMHCPQQVSNVAWKVSFDVDPALATRTRQRIHDDLIEHGGAALGCHFPSLVPVAP